MKGILKSSKKININNNDFINKKGLIIRSSNLKDDFVDYEISKSELKYENLQTGYQRILESSILLNTRDGKIKPSYIKLDDNDEIYLASGIRAFTLKKTSYIQMIDYLIYALSSDKVKRYVEGYSLGSSIQYLSIDDLMNIEMPVPSIKQQQYILSN